MENNSGNLTINPQIKNTYGFLILSCSSVLIGTVSKDKKEINFESAFNNKDWKEIRGHSRNRFFRIFMDRQREVTKYIDEHLEQFFIKDNMLNISGLIIAGQKNPINRYLTNKIRKLTMDKYITTIIELEYDGKSGFDQAIYLSMINDNL